MEMKKDIFLFGAFAASLCVPAIAVAADEPGLDQVRAAAERYADINVAIAEGFVRDPDDHCVVAADVGMDPALGAMGVHYIRFDRLGVTGPPNPRVSGTGTHTNFLEPAILLYEPQEDGSMELVGIENLVFKSSWLGAGNDAPPVFHGVTWDEMTDDPATEIDEAHKFEPHFDRHVWIFRDNPNGVFAQFNPNVSCAHHHGAGHMEMDHGD